MENDEAVIYLMNLAMRNGIGINFMNLDSHTPAGTNTKTKLIAMNSNWYKRKEIPFQLAHELGHIFNHDDLQSCLYFSPSKNGIEGKANKTAIHLLMTPYLEEKSEDNISSADFIDQFDIPYALENVVEKEIRNYYD